MLSIPASRRKGVEGLLIYFNAEPEFTHNIEILLKELKKFLDIPDNIKEASQLTNYAVQTRYPGEYAEITKEEYERSVFMAKECLHWVENIIATEKN